MSQPIRSLPDNPSLEQQKKLAKELLKAFESGGADARARVRAQLPDKPLITLADAQFVLAREYGFESWAALKQHIDSNAAMAHGRRLHEEAARIFSRRDSVALRALFKREPAARALINEPVFPYGSTALVSVAADADPAFIDVLLEFGADPNRRSDWAMGPWHALHSANDAIADRLIEAGAIVDACAAAHLGRVDLLRDILDADPSRVHERGGDGQTPLHFARTREVVDLLLERGADPDARDFDHRSTAAEWMLKQKRGEGRYELAKYLVERGASADIFLACALGLTERLRSMLEVDAALLNLRTHEGEYGEKPPSSCHIYTWTIGQHLSPLQVAAQFEQDEVVTLLSQFATTKQRLLAACATGNEKEARALLQESPDLLEQLSDDDQRLLADAGWAANARAVELMLAVGFDPRATGGSGGTVLHCAAWQGSVECVSIALRYPSVRELVNDTDAVYHSTPLGWCCHGAAHCGNSRADHVAVARLLLEAGARPDAQLVRDAPPALARVFREWQGGS